MQWTTKLSAFIYCIHLRNKLFFSGLQSHSHKGQILGWSLDGNKVLIFSDPGECVCSLSAHPLEESITSGSVKSQEKFKTTDGCQAMGHICLGKIAVQFHISREIDFSLNV